MPANGIRVILALSQLQRTVVSVGNKTLPENAKHTVRCFNCKKINHFAKCCNSKTMSVRTEKAHLVTNSRNECNSSSNESTNCIPVIQYDRKMIATVTVANGKVNNTWNFSWILRQLATC